MRGLIATAAGSEELEERGNGGTNHSPALELGRVRRLCYPYPAHVFIHFHAVRAQNISSACEAMSTVHDFSFTVYSACVRVPPYPGTYSHLAVVVPRHARSAKSGIAHVSLLGSENTG